MYKAAARLFPGITACVKRGPPIFSAGRLGYGPNRNILKRAHRAKAISIVSANTVAVGALAADPSPTPSTQFCSAGEVYIYTSAGAIWNQQAILRAGNLGESDRFGSALGLDGNLLVVGAPGENSPSGGIDGNGSLSGPADSGAACVFRRQGTTWSQWSYLKAAIPRQGAWFGNANAVSISGGHGCDRFSGGS